MYSNGLQLNADKSFAAIPTYPVVLSFKGDSQELNLFASRMGKPPPGMPPVDLDKMVSCPCTRVQTLMYANTVTWLPVDSDSEGPPAGQWPGVDVDDQVYGRR
jgi:hypothetical protein